MSDKWWWPVKKVWAAIWGVLGMGVAGLIAGVAGYDWASLGVWGPAVGAALAAGLAWLARQTDDEAPGL